MDEIREDAKDLTDKISDWADDTAEDMEEKGEELKADFNDFKRKLKKINNKQVINGCGL